jgi:DNA-directed RNA polymerase subunit RPC12/RpoP
MIVFNCTSCQTALSVPNHLAGKLVRCPTCKQTQDVPATPNSGTAAVPEAVAAGATTGSASATSSVASPPALPKPSTPPPLSKTGTFLAGFGGVGRPTGRRYGFNCGYCSSRLEGSESIAAQEGQCPTCGNNIVIPILDRYGRLIDPKSGQIIKQDPHPVHCYAAAGERAPRILRKQDGQQCIQCPRCSSINPISSNNCKNCGMPFTMEGTTADATGPLNAFCIASLALGVISLGTALTIIIPVLAVVAGIIGISQLKSSETVATGRTQAIVGITLGTICALIGIMHRL